MQLMLDGIDEPLLEQAMLRQITRSSYYALFHAFSTQAADRLALPGSVEYQRVYRALDHGPCKKACNAVIGQPRWSPAIKQCAGLFQVLHEARHDADYNPVWVPNQWDAITHSIDAERAIAALESATESERRAFVLCLILKERN